MNVEIHASTILMKDGGKIKVRGSYQDTNEYYSHPRIFYSDEVFIK